MATKNVEIKIIGKDQASKAIKSVSGSLRSFGKAAKGIVLGGITAVTGAVVGLGAGFVKLAKDAAPLAVIEDSFAQMTESIGSSADEMLRPPW